MANLEIENLKILVVKTYGKALNTTTDFEEFSYHMKRKINKTLSASTLKRIWGYVKDEHRSRGMTLDILSQYVGHKDYAEFVEWLQMRHLSNSSFFNAEQVISSDLEPGERVDIGWCPNRLVKLHYLGENRFEVTASENSKLHAGDRFVAGCFIKGKPLYLPYIERDGERTAPFVAARQSGLSTLQIIKTNE